MPISYLPRPAGSHSKLNTIRDGWGVLKTIFRIFKDHKPLPFFTFVAVTLGLLGLVIGMLPIIDFIRFSYVYRVPSAILAAGLEIMAMLLFCSGVILDTIARHHLENYELHLHEFHAREQAASWSESDPRHHKSIHDMSSEDPVTRKVH